MPLHGLNYGQSMYYAHDRIPVTLCPDLRLPRGMEGLYDPVTESVGLDRRLPWDTKRCVLVHELVHWAYGDADGTHEDRCRLMTARILIRPVEYMTAAAMYEDTYDIAMELNVTPAIIDDWQRWAYDNPIEIVKGR